MRSGSQKLQHRTLDRKIKLNKNEIVVNVNLKNIPKITWSDFLLALEVEDISCKQKKKTFCGSTYVCNSFIQSVIKIHVPGDSSFTARTINPIKKLVKITKL
jgi:hypothetical protein